MREAPQLAGAGDGAVMVAGDFNAHIWLPSLFAIAHALTRACRALWPTSSYRIDDLGHSGPVANL